MHSETYDFKSVESKWQKNWQQRSSALTTHNAQLTTLEKKFYCLVMFPYPSGKIHMGHARNYCIGDVVARYKRMRGYHVLHPIGWDAFGLPAENAAIEHGTDPEKWTKQNIDEMRADIKTLGISYDWEREFATCDSEYYHWNQWFFVQLFKQGLAYKKKSEVNWCPKCETVLANEQVHDGHCWRCDAEITHKELDQWYFKITDYAEKLLDDLKLLEGQWPDEVILMQRNWIGKSVGAEVEFEIADGKMKDHQLSAISHKLKVFTTRPDTLFGCTFLVISPEHPLSLEVGSQKLEVRKYCKDAKRKSKIERTTAAGKTGVFTGLYAANPVNGEKLPIWVADYVLAEYGTGAIMAVPAHDQRDFEFAKKYNLPVREVIQPASRSELSVESLEIKHKTKSTGFNSQLTTHNSQLKEAYEGEGTLINSGKFSGMTSTEAKKKITQMLQDQNKGKESITYRIRDWLISRQRYWGTPIPVVNCAKCGNVSLAETDLPVILPKNVRFTGKGESPLAQVKEFVHTKCPKCGGEAKRETDTMDTFMDSSWYFLRYCDPKNSLKPFDPQIANSWVPVDQYIGGIEHACMHLIYSRFFHKVLYDMGMVESKEPFTHLLTQGMVTMGGSAMSKSKGNIVAVEKMVNEYGADTARLFVLFASPPKNQLEWSEEGVQGCWRFLNRIWRMRQKIAECKEQRTNSSTPLDSPLQRGKEKGDDSMRYALSSVLEKKTHWAIKKVQDDIEKDFQFNTAIAALMELMNTLSDYPAWGDDASKESFRNLLILLYPFAPHISSELWENLNFEPKNLDEISYPIYAPEILKESVIEIVIQLNGKLKAKFSLSVEISKNESQVAGEARKILAEKGFKDELNNYKFVPGRLINFIITQKVEAKR